MWCVSAKIIIIIIIIIIVVVVLDHPFSQKCSLTRHRKEGCGFDEEEGEEKKTQREYERYARSFSKGGIYVGYKFLTFELIEKYDIQVPAFLNQFMAATE